VNFICNCIDIIVVRIVAFVVLKMLVSGEVEALFTVLAKAELENAPLRVIAADLQKHFQPDDQFRIASALQILVVNRILTPAQRLSALYFIALQNGSSMSLGPSAAPSANQGGPAIGPFLPFLLDILDNGKFESSAERQFLILLVCGNLEEVSFSRCF
jgi:hypothetical protein